NLPWSFTREELREACGFSRLELSNDFAALARAVPHLEPQDLHRIGGGDPDPEGTKIVLGPGTGLGLAGIVKTDLGWLPVPGEAGHISLPVRNALELAIRDRVAKGEEHVSVEDLLSGPGLA